MRKTLLFIILLFSASIIYGQSEKLIPITPRVNVQADSAKLSQIIDNQWVAVGIAKPHAIMHDYNLMFDGKPSYRFELQEDDNTLQDYKEGATKGRAELSYCYATSANFANHSSQEYDAAQKMKNVYHSGKGISEQGSTVEYQFSVYIPSSLSKKTSSIFAQWHGMPDRRLAETPEGEIKMLTTQEFLDVYDHTIFKKDTGHARIMKDGKEKAGKPNGWKIEQGGYPPLAFGFSNGWFYIKANSDRKWMTDKSDRCNASPDKYETMEASKSEYKISTIAYKMPFEDFPKDCWITFTTTIDWTKYSGATNQIVKAGKLDVLMQYAEKEKKENKKIVDNQTIMIGRNDDAGYYFKFGIYRVGNSTEPVVYNLAKYSEKPVTK